MFTGIIQAIGHIASIEQKANDCSLKVHTGKLDMTLTQPGDSIAVNGVCLTAVSLGPDYFSADVSNETLSLTTLSELGINSPVNLEKALTLSTPLGGHLVSGHVDGVGHIVRRWGDGRSERFEIEAPKNLAKYIAQKGSVCIDGTSLTVNAVNGVKFELNIVPHTLVETIIGDYQSGRKVNIEVDLLARYMERLMMNDAPESPDSGISKAFLAQHGFDK